MKILVINTVPFDQNGITSVIMNYYRNMQRTEIQIDFAAVGEMGEVFHRELTASGAHVFVLPKKKRMAMYLVQLNRLIAAGEYDIIHVHGNSATLVAETAAAWRHHVPVRIAHSHNTTCMHRAIHTALYPVFRRTCTHRLACGEAAGKWMFRTDSFIILKNGIDLTRFQFDAGERMRCREQLGIERNEILLGHVANFVVQKNHPFLIAVFAALVRRQPNTRLLLIGEGGQMSAIRQDVKRRGLEHAVIFLGKTDRPERYYQAMDVFLLPSLFEGVPVVLAEAQAAGLPCLAADTVAREANLTGSVQFLPIDDPEKWACEIVYTIQMTKARDRDRICAQWQKQIAAAGYDVAQNADTLRRLYQTFLAQSRRNGGGRK